MTQVNYLFVIYITESIFTAAVYMRENLAALYRLSWRKIVEILIRICMTYLPVAEMVLSWPDVTSGDEETGSTEEVTRIILILLFLVKIWLHIINLKTCSDFKCSVMLRSKFQGKGLIYLLEMFWVSKVKKNLKNVLLDKTIKLK